MTASARLSQDALSVTLPVGGSAELVTEYMPGIGATVINTGLTTIYLGTRSSVTPSTGLPLFAGTSAPWTTAGTLYAIADPNGNSPGRVLVTSMVGSWTNPAATAAAIQGLTLSVQGDVQVTGPIDVTGSTVGVTGPVDVSGSSVGVSGTVGVSGGTVAVSGVGGTVAVGGTVGVSGVGGTVNVGGSVGVTGGTVAVSGVGGTVAVGGTVGVSGVGGTVNVGGTVGMTQGGLLLVAGTVPDATVQPMVACGTYSSLHVRTSPTGTRSLLRIEFYADLAGTQFISAALIPVPLAGAAASVLTPVRGPYFRPYAIGAATVLVYGSSRIALDDVYASAGTNLGSWRSIGAVSAGVTYPLTDSYSGRQYITSQGGPSSWRLISQASNGFFGYRFMDTTGALRDALLMNYPTAGAEAFFTFTMPRGIVIPLFYAGGTGGSGGSVTEVDISTVA